MSVHENSEFSSIGLGIHYDAELVAADRLVADMLASLPRGAVLVVTADHGQVDVGDRLVEVHSEVMAHVSYQSGEGRFRWLHARPGRSDLLLAAAQTHHSDHAWVRSVEETIIEGWGGSTVSDAARARLGDVALVSRDPIAFHDPTDSGPFQLVGRHGSLTSAEMLVPLLAAGH